MHADALRTGKGGRPTFPMGKRVESSALRAMPSLGDGEAWPPPLDGARRRYEASLRPLREPKKVFDYAAALFHRGEEDDLVEAFSLFSRLASSAVERTEVGNRFVAYRAVALYNATRCMEALPSRKARAVSGELLLRAVEAVGDAVVDGIRRAASEASASIETRARPSALVWRSAGVLVPTDRAGLARLPSLPREIAGSWRGVRAGLCESGFDAPLECRVAGAVLVALPTPRTVRVERA